MHGMEISRTVHGYLARYPRARVNLQTLGGRIKTAYAPASLHSGGISEVW